MGLIDTIADIDMAVLISETDASDVTGELRMSSC